MDVLILFFLCALAEFMRPSGHQFDHIALAIAPVIMAGVAQGAAGAITSSLLGGKKKKVTQVPLETPEQAQARRDLLAYGQTGKIDGYTAGEAYSGELGDFKLSDTEKAGQGLLSKFVGAGRPELFDRGAQELTNLLTSGKYDPNDPSGEYSTFKRQADRELKDSITKTKRGLAYTGDLYATDAGRQISEQVGKTNEALDSKLAELSDKYITRKLNAIPLAGQMSAQQQQLDLAPVAAAATYGGEERKLRTAEDTANLTEWIRQRQEKSTRVDALKAVAGQNAQFGVPSATSTIPGPFDSLLGQAGQAGIQELIQQYFLKGGSGSGGVDMSNRNDPNQVFFE